MTNSESPRERTDLPPKIDALCARFEDRLRRGESVRIEDVLEDIEQADRSKYLRLLLPIEWEHRRRSEQSVDLQEYLVRFPSAKFLVETIYQQENHWSDAVGELQEALEQNDSQANSPSVRFLPHGRFLPGSNIAGRYRIVSLLGKGGMGEVYRADDLRIGQTVALKFLPLALARDSQRLAQFQSEVRLARQISHPNVCRVYDMDQVDGERFLSMEYIDGEDLSVLLRRIGLLPHHKGVQFAQQLCAGVAAAHDNGVLHRDLKPANIMIDGRGQVRITDFGLAKLTSEPHEHEIAGTPAYMAPEQLSHGQTSIQSDLYALGLILFEVFAGKPTPDVESLTQLLRNTDSVSTTSPSNEAMNLDPAIGRVILHCLEQDPGDRPQSARAIAADLPGGSPLSATIAGGETPSPQMIAAAGSVGHISGRFGVFAFAAICAGLLLVAWLSDRTNIVNRVVLEKHPRVLASDANQIVKAFGYDDLPVGTAWEFAIDYDCLSYVRGNTDLVSNETDRLTGQPPAVFYWYRHSPVPFEPERFYGSGSFRRLAGVTINDPPNRHAGMITLRLDTKGHLVEFHATPSQRDLVVDSSGAEDWVEMFQSNASSILGFALTDFQVASPQWAPPTICDSRRAWEGAYPNGVPIRVEAAGYRGKPVYVHVIGDWTSAERESNPAASVGMIAGLRPVVWMLTIAVSILLAFRNFRSGKGDRRGAWRFGIFFLICDMLVWLLAANHVPTIVGESKQLFASLAWSVLNAVEYGLIYFAIEPYVRRHCPQTMISWSRVLSGRLRDPLVGRHLLIGVAAGVVFKLVLQMSVLTDGLTEQWGSTASCLPALVGTQRSLLEMIMTLTNASWLGLRTLMIFMIAIVVLRNRWFAAGALILFSILMYGDITSRPWQSSIWIAAYWLLVAVVLVRFGLLPVIVGIAVGVFLLQWPITTDTSAWYFGHGVSALLATTVAAGYGCYIAAGPRPIHARAM